MEIINKNHKDITQNQRVSLSPYFKVESEKALYFSAGACHLYGLLPGLTINFIEDGDRWYFYAGNDPDGFKLINRKGKNSVLICDASLVKMILKKTRISIGTHFLINQTEIKKKGCHLLQIDWNCPIESPWIL